MCSDCDTDIDSLGKTLESTLDGPVSLLNRMRLACMPLTREGTALACSKSGEHFHPLVDSTWLMLTSQLEMLAGR